MLWFRSRLQLGAKVQERFAFYIWGDLGILWPTKNDLKSHDIESKFCTTIKNTYIFQKDTIMPFFQGVSKLWSIKVCCQTNVETFWVRGYFFALLYSEYRCSPDNPGSVPGQRKLWEPVFLQTFSLQGLTIVFLRLLDVFY